MTSHHPMTMNNRSNNGAGELETFAMANCLMLLNKQNSTTLTRGGTTYDESTWFPCKTCGRKFPSFQALGGHRASHNKFNSSLLSNEGTLSLLNPSLSSKKPKSHVCMVCGAQFHIGQALGGHMRRHRKTPVSGGGSSVTVETCEISGGDHKRKLVEQVINGLVPSLKRLGSGKRVCLDNLDLNLYLWNDKCDENDGYGVVDEGKVVEEVDEENEFLMLELRQPIN